MLQSLISETELPGKKVNYDTLQIISHRYFWCSQFTSGKKILEVGCGPGFGIGYLSRSAVQVTAGDITWDSLILAKNHYGPHSHFVQMDGHQLPFKDNSFDVVICVAAIIYMSLPLILKEFRRVLKNPGLLLINTPNKEIPHFKESPLSQEYHSIPQWNSLLRNNHFDPKFYGAFNVTNIFQRLQNKISSGFGIKNFYLKEEIDENAVSSIQNLELKFLDSTSSDKKHRIIYIVAYKA